jgi:tetratricopeptide (TPR) repeat protein
VRIVHPFLALIVLLAVFRPTEFRAQQEASKQPKGKVEVSPCDRSVDEYLAELEKSKKKKGIHNPLPTDACILGWCKEIAGPTNHPPTESKPSTEKSDNRAAEARPASPAGESSSKRSASEIRVAPENTVVAECDPQQAAQDVGVGDYYFSQKSYKPALNRYRLALENKPSDPAIYLRLARTYEKLKDTDNALKNYHSVLEHSDAQSQRAKEAQTALARIEKK